MYSSEPERSLSSAETLCCGEVEDSVDSGFDGGITWDREKSMSLCGVVSLSFCELEQLEAFSGQQNVNIDFCGRLFCLLRLLQC